MNRQRPKPLCKEESTQARLLAIRDRIAARHCTCADCEDYKFLLLLLRKEVVWAANEAEWQANHKETV